MNANHEVPKAAIRLLRQALESGTVLPVTATGRSMVPVIFPGEEVQIQRCPVQDLRIGDVVLLDRGDRMVLHRIFRFEYRGNERIPAALFTKGDGCFSGDPPAAPEAVLGKVVGLTGSRLRQGVWRVLDVFFRGLSVFVFEQHSQRLGWIYRYILRPGKSAATGLRMSGSQRVD